MSLEINGYLLKERIDLGNFASGAIGTAAATVDIVSNIGINQTTASQILSLPNPTDTRNGRSVSVANSGTQAFTMHGVVIAPSNYSTFEFHGGTWRTMTAIAASDYWRDVITGNRNIPDGSADDTYVGVVHAGPVHMGTDGVVGDQGFHHEAIVSYQGNGTFANQVIQTNIPIDSTIMPTIFIKGYAYGNANSVDLQLSLYTYSSPSGSIINTVWSNTGSTAPTLIRAGYSGGLLALELTWAAADQYYNRYEVSAYCDGNANHQAEWFQGWGVTSAVFAGTVTNVVTVTKKQAGGGFDFWQTNPGGIGPDGVTDITDSIIRKGQTNITIGTAGDSGLTLGDVHGGTGVTAPTYRAGIENGNTVTAIGVDVNGKVRLSNSLAVTDSRGINTLPQDYPMGTYEEFKQSSTIGLTVPAVPTYVQVHTNRQYGFATDLSGGPVRQDVDLLDGRQYFRLSTAATTWGTWMLESKPASDFDLQNLLELNGTAKVSLSGEVSWTNRFITMTAGGRTQELSGYHDINMPAVGTAIPKSDGTTVTVTAATAGQTGASGGIALLAWESLWYYAPRNVGSAASVAANFRIQRYQDSNTAAAGLNGATVNGDMDSSEWVRIVSRDDANTFFWGTGDTARLGYQIGQGTDVQEVAERQADKTRYLANGYAYRPWNLTASAVSFGFSNYIRTISSGSNNGYSMASGYRDINAPAAGVNVYDTTGAVVTTWRTNVANDAMNRMGEVFGGQLANTATVVDFPTGYTSLYYAHDTNGSTATGTWYLVRYNATHSVPPHWIFVAGRRDDDNDRILLWNGEYLDRGDCLYRGKRELSQERSRGTVTSQGQYDCRWTQANFFAGTAANGLNTSGSTNGVLVHWPDSTLMWGMDSSDPHSGNYIWLMMPSAGYNIPMLDSTGTLTRVVQTIGGRKYVPLGQWESFVYIPQPYGSSSVTVDRGWFIVNYGNARNIPAHAITVASFAAPSSISGTGLNKARVKMADGVYIQPGVALAVGTPTVNDHAQGTSLDWRAIVAAGQTPPAGSAGVPAVAGVSNSNASFRYMASQTHAQGRVEMTGYINTTAAIPDGTVVAFLPGVYPDARENNWIGVSARHGANNVTPAHCFVVPVANSYGGQSGTELRLYGYSAGNNAAAAGGAYGASGLVTFAGLSFVHA